MRKEVTNDEKKNLIALLMHREFEKKIMKILDNERSLNKIDKKLDPLIRRYFIELDILYKFYRSNEDERNGGLSDYTIKCQKCALLTNLMQRQFEDKMQIMLLEASDILDADFKIAKYIKRFWENERTVYEFYDLDYDETCGAE